MPEKRKPLKRRSRSFARTRIHESLSVREALLFTSRGNELAGRGRPAFHIFSIGLTCVGEKTRAGG